MQENLIQIIKAITALDYVDNPGQIDVAQSDWVEFLELFLKMKMVRIVYMRLTNTFDDMPALNSTGIFYHIQNPNMDCAEMGEIFNDLLLEFRWFSWNPYHEASILLADDITAVLSQEDRTSDLFRASLVHEVSSTDLEAVVKFVVDFFNTDLFYLDPDCAEYEIRLRKLPWIHRALQCRHIDLSVQEILKEGITGQYFYRGKDCVYCLEAVVDTETYDHYPRLFAPFKTTVLEMLAKEVCKQERRDREEKADNLKAE